MTTWIIDGRRCPECTFRRNEYRHLKRCVPQRYWPPEGEWADNQPQPVRLPQRIGIYPRSVYEQAFPSRSVAVVERPIISNQTIYLDDLTCDCGYVATSESALRMHRMRSKAHRG